MPVHDPNVYYKLPGRLQAESYLAAKDSDIAVTKETDGFLEMQMLGTSGSLDYNVATPQAGVYSVQLRFAGTPTTKIDILSGETVLGSAQATQQGWQTVAANIQLPAGNQTIKVHSNSAVRINWMEFSAAR
jgi:hypothetical protein